MKCRAFSRYLRATALAAALAVVLGGCYMPIRFDAEIEISRAGYYKMIFDGYVAKVHLYEGLRKGEVSPAKEREEVAKIETDITRDPSVSEFKYYKMGHFKVHWERNGDLTKTRAVTFIRRNEYILGLTYNRDTGRVAMAGRSIKRDIKQQLHDMGLGITGTIRVFSDAKVAAHNATSVKRNKRLGGNYKTYTWNIKTIFDPTPSLILALR